MPILDLQKRSRELGRIRMGQVVPTSGGRTRPEKLDRFRITSASKPLLDKVGALYGGEVREWTPANGGPQQWEVLITDQRIPIMVPPQPVTQWLETWTGGGCVHRCDGYTNVLTDEACDPEDRDHVNAKPTTRLNVVLRDIEGIGVFRLETHGWHAAAELPAVADFLANAGGYVEAWLTLEEKKITGEWNGKVETRRFMVPKIDVDVTPAQLLAGKGGVAAPAVEGPVEARQIEGGKPNLPTLDDIAACSNEAALRKIWELLDQHGQVDEGSDMLAAITARKVQLDSKADAVQGEVVDGDADTAWEHILKTGGQLDMTLTQLQEAFAQANGGLSPATASAGELQVFLAALEGELAESQAKAS